MKRLLVLSLIGILTIACKNQENSTDVTVVTPTAVSANQEKNVFEGEFIYSEDVGVLTTKNEIYAVQVDDKMMQLQELAAPLKKTDFDMVNVVIVADTIPNPMKAERGYGWDQMIIIKEIKEVTPGTSAAVVAPIN